MRDNNESRPNKSDFNKTSRDGEHDSELNIHKSFPKKKAPMDKENHPDNHNPAPTRTSLASITFPPSPTKTDKTKKGPKEPFHGANS